VIRWFLVVTVLVGALVCGGIALLSDDQVAAHETPPPAVATAAWSARRVPQPFVDAVGATRLQAALDAAVGTSDACFSVLTSSGPVAGRAADAPYVGASTQKLMTSAAALAVLGPETRFTTRVAAGAEPANGTVDRLFFVGGGDPLLSTAEYRAFLASDPKTAATPTTPLETVADAIVAEGVRRVNALLVDDSRHETLRYLPSWSPSYRTEGQVGPLGALTVNHGFSVLRPQGSVPVDDPAVFAGGELVKMLRARGVTVNGAVTRAVAPEGAVDIARVDSPTVTQIAGEVISASDNLASELLVREIGVKAAKQGTTAAGLAAATAKLAELGVPMTGVTLADGSGLARDNRVTCQALSATMDLGARPEFRILWDGLSVAGQSGTLADELQGTGLEGRLRGKTGFLNGVTGLAGLVDVGRPLRFAFVINGNFGEPQAIRIRAQLAQIISRFPEAPPADQLVPLPVAPTSTPAAPPTVGVTAP
jgi:D-alanyl-D-alanine carboxypeptidase/D-alanyl-D-alanine-endopeptidase (penicillin-binding protein 4)